MYKYGMIADLLLSSTGYNLAGRTPGRLIVLPDFGPLFLSYFIQLLLFFLNKKSIWLHKHTQAYNKLAINLFHASGDFCKTFANSLDPDQDQ